MTKKREIEGRTKTIFIDFFLQTLSILDLPLKAASPRGVKSQMKNGLAWGLFYKIYSSIVQGHLEEPGRFIKSSISWKKHFSIHRFSMMSIFFKKNLLHLSDMATLGWVNGSFPVYFKTSPKTLFSIHVYRYYSSIFL